MFVPLLLQVCWELFRSVGSQSAHACCGIQSGSNLMKCLAETSFCVNAGSATSASAVALGMFYSPNIISYSSYNLLVNTIFFEKHKYTFRVMTEASGDDVNPTDRRWNKINEIFKCNLESTFNQSLALNLTFNQNLSKKIGSME